MAKNKLIKYERVKSLPNVIFSEFGETVSPLSYPWYEARHDGMTKVLELGCGKGEHSLAFALETPSKLCIGIDSKSHRICSGAEIAIGQGLENIYFLRAHIERIEEFFTAHSIDEIWLTFPDPHPKKRSIKSRLTSPSFLDAYSKLLVPGGTVFLKTDSGLLYDYTQQSVEQWGGKIVEKSDNMHDSRGITQSAGDVVSAFEKKALKKEITIKYLAFQLK
jgi:tRNA (guanine-N7-)-methyltransferase